MNSALHTAKNSLPTFDLIWWNSRDENPDLSQAARGQFHVLSADESIIVSQKKKESLSPPDFSTGNSQRQCLLSQA